MAYDPQRDRPRRRADDNEPSPVDSLLDGVPPPRPDDAPSASDSPPADAPASAGPIGSWSDRLLYSGGFSTMLKAAVVVAALGWMWRRMRRRRPR